MSDLVMWPDALQVDLRLFMLSLRRAATPAFVLESARVIAYHAQLTDKASYSCEPSRFPEKRGSHCTPGIAAAEAGTYPRIANDFCANATHAIAYIPHKPSG